MPYDERLAERVRGALGSVSGVTEKQMFGGIAFMRDGAMLIGVNRKDLIVRCAKEETDSHLKRKGVRVFDLSGGRPMKGWLLVGAVATDADGGLREWVDFALTAADGTGSTRRKSATVRASKPRKRS
ncbi:MAG: TfoX/Sxy family protein [Gemmatimonadetes bacterium]|nr:TfoX/Sxy family protein [Gemmatimonadota bacterium]